MRSARLTIACIGLAFAMPAAGQSEASLLWRCWYQEEPRPVIACRLAAMQVADARAAPDTQWDRIPPFARQLRTAPESLAGEVVLIPTHGPAMDERLTARLAQSVMCGSRAGCRVDFRMSP